MNKKYSFVLHFFLRKLFFVSVLLSFSGIYAQQIIFPKKLDSTYYISILDSLKQTFKNCKKIPPEYELSFYTALSHYPELVDINIDMKLSTFRSTMAARPAKKFFAHRTKRVYRIYVNTKEKLTGVLASDLNFNQKVGILGHELAHVLDYTRKSFFEIVGTGLRYMFLNYRRKLEAATDIETIKRGLGWQLYEFEDYVRNRSDASKKYLKKKTRVYLDEKQIMQLIIEQENQK